MRLDLYLVKEKLAVSRTQAQDFIASGFVYRTKDEKQVQMSKASHEVNEGEQITVVANKLQKYVSRGGLKLEAALEKLKLDVSGKIILDIGQSTGGFTDCLLQRGAEKVFGIDVGHSQLHESLKKDTRVTYFENLNVKDLSVNTNFIRALPDKQFDFIVIDVSFISLAKIIPSIANFLGEGGQYLALVKPQFECGKDKLDKNGIVTDSNIFETVEIEIKKMAEQYFKNVSAYFECEILGKDGNQEFFIYGKKSM